MLTNMSTNISKLLCSLSLEYVNKNKKVEMPVDHNNYVHIIE